MTIDKSNPRWKHLDAVLAPLFAPIHESERNLLRPAKEDMERKSRTFYFGKEGKPFVMEMLDEDLCVPRLEPR